MKRLLLTACFILAAGIETLAADLTFYLGTTGQTLYARFQTAGGTYVANALTEGTSGAAGNYRLAESTIAGLSGMSTAGNYPFTIRSGAASTTAGDPIVAFGTLRWDGTQEVTSTAAGRKTTTFGVVGTAHAGSTTGINVATSGIDTTGADYLFVVANYLSDGDPPTISDSKGNRFTSLNVTTNTWVEQQVYVCVNPRVGSGHTFTATSAGKSPSIFVIATSGLRLASYSDQSATNTGVGTTLQPGSITPSEANCLVLQTCLVGSTGTPSINESYTASALGLNSAGGNHIGGGLGYKIQTTATATNPTWTAGGTGSINATAWSFLPQADENEITVTPFEDGRVIQRDSGAESKRVTLSGRYEGAKPQQVEVQVYEWNTSTVVTPWAAVGGLTASGGAWSGTLTIPQGGWYALAARGKDADGIVRATSIATSAKVGVGVLVAMIGQSNCVRLFDDYGDGWVASDLTRKHTASGWATNTGEGATALANALATQLGCPVGLLNYAVSGVGLGYNAGSGYWLDTTPGAPYPLFQAGLAAAGGDCEYVVWQGCEADALNASFTDAGLRANFDTLYGRLKTDTKRDASTLKFVVGVPGPLADAGTTDARWSGIRNACIGWADATTGALLAGSLVDGVLVDAYHFDGVDYDRAGRRFAQTILHDAGVAANSGRGPQIFKTWRASGAAIVYVQLADLAAAGIAEVDGTTDGGSLTGFQLSTDDFASTLNVSATAIEENCVKLTLSAAPADSATLKLRYCYGKTPTITNLPYRATNPQGSTRGLPLLPATATSVELRAAYANPSLLTQATLPIRRPRDVGYAVRDVDGPLLTARATTNVTLVAETETTGTYSTFVNQDAGYVVWDNGGDEVADALHGSGGGATVSAAFVDEDHTWGFDDRAQITSPNDVTESSSAAVLVQMDFTEPMPAAASIASITSVTIGDVAGATEPTVTTSAVDGTKKKVIITLNTASATAATYIVTVKILTVDNQTFTRKGRLIVP